MQDPRKYKITRLIITLVSLFIISSFLFTACTTQKKPEILKIGLMSDVGAVPFLLAKENGFFEKAGLDVEITVFKSAVDRDSALQTGNLDGAMADMLAAVFFNQAGFDIKMAAATYGNYKMVTSPDLSKESMLNLDTIKIGLSSNTVIDFASQTIAKASGFESKLEKVAIPQMPVRLEMLRAGELNGATLPEPLASAALLAGGERVGSTEVFNLYPGVFLVSEKSLKENHKIWVKFFEAYDQGIDALNAKKIEVSFDELVAQLGFPDVLKDTFTLPNYTKIKAPDETTYSAIMNWMLESKLSETEITFKDLTDVEALRR